MELCFEHFVKISKNIVMQGRQSIILDTIVDVSALFSLVTIV